MGDGSALSSDDSRAGTRVAGELVTRGSKAKCVPERAERRTCRLGASLTVGQAVLRAKLKRCSAAMPITMTPLRIAAKKHHTEVSAVR
jgi:hypothetical protein